MSLEHPDDLVYTESHEWIDPDSGRVGVSDYAQDELGDVVYVELPAEGDDVVAGEAFGVIESIKAVSDIYSPVDGVVRDVNQDVVERPETVNEDVYGDGWLIEVDFDSVDGLMSADEYVEGLD
ncbi:MAG: glycine cleavage system protein GcvH [Halobacteriales archaeon]